MPTVPGGLQAYRAMLMDSLTGEREKVAHQFTGALNRSIGKGTRPTIRTGVPEFPKDSILDYSDFGADPMAHLTRRDIVLPKTQRGLESLLPPFRSPNRMQDILGAANQGAERGGHLWYNTEPLYTFADRYAPEADVNQFLRIGAPFSAQTPVDKEIKQGAFANYFLKKYGRLPEPDEMMDIEKSILGGGGSLADKLQWAKESLEHGKMQAPESPTGELAGKTKLIPYDEARRGNQWNAVMDTWMLNSLGINPMSGPSKKGGAEMGLKLLAERSGMTPRNFQSSVWTGVQGDTRPYAQILDELVQGSAGNVGKKGHEHMADVLSGRDYIRDEPANFDKGGLASYVRYRLRQEAKNASYGPMRAKLEQWGRESISDPFDVSPSGRKALALGDDKVVKIVGREPRGFREQEIEGDPSAGLLLPQLHYRSPEGELTVLERIMNTEKGNQEHFARPMENAFRGAMNEGIDPSIAHLEDAELESLMDERGLERFRNFNLLGGDFFSPPHWGFRGNYLGPRSSSPVMLDAGSLDSDLVGMSTHRQFMPQMRETASGRAEYLAKALGKKMDPDFLRAIAEESPEDMIYKFTDTRDVAPLKASPLRNRQQLHIEWPEAKGGRISLKLAKAAAALKEQIAPDSPDIGHSFAGGGVVRNWLRGVKGSGIDDVLTAMKERYGPRAGEEEAMKAKAGIYGVGTPDAIETAVGHTKRRVAAREWIDRNLGNYIVRQLGAEDDPVRELLAPQLAQQYGGREPGLVRRIPAAQVPERFNWKDASGALVSPDRPGSAPAWLQALIEQDTPRHTKAAEILKAKSKALDESPYARGDRRAAVDQASKDYLQAQAGNYAFDGLPDPIMLHDLDPQNWQRYMHEPMQGMMDYLGQHYTPEQLPKVSVPDALRGSLAWHEALAKKKAEVMKDPFAGTVVHKEYPTGFKWVKFAPPDQSNLPEGEVASAFQERKNILESALEKEGDAMGHCVGGYCDDVISGQSHIYSLRDPQGQPHVTLEVNPRGSAEADDQYGVANSMHDISQIKGKGNKAPVKEYLPYVQDFVRSGKWGEVGDLQNTGMTLRGGRYLLPGEVNQFARYKLGDTKRWLTEDEHVKQNLQDPWWQNFEYEGTGKGEPSIRKALQSRPEGKGMRYDIPDDWQPGPIGFAEGGLVTRPQPGSEEEKPGYDLDEDAIEELLELLA